MVFHYMVCPITVSPTLPPYMQTCKVLSYFLCGFAVMMGIAVSSFSTERKRALPVIKTANAQKLLLQVGRENLNDEQKDLVAGTAMDMLYLQTYYENNSKDKKGQRKGTHPHPQSASPMLTTVSVVPSYNQSRSIKAMAIATLIPVLLLMITVLELWPFVMEVISALGILYVVYSTSSTSLTPDKICS